MGNEVLIFERLLILASLALSEGERGRCKIDLLLFLFEGKLRFCSDYLRFFKKTSREQA